MSHMPSQSPMRREPLQVVTEIEVQALARDVRAREAVESSCSSHCRSRKLLLGNYSAYGPFPWGAGLASDAATGLATGSDALVGVATGAGSGSAGAFLLARRPW